MTVVKNKQEHDRALSIVKNIFDKTIELCRFYGYGKLRHNCYGNMV